MALFFRTLQRMFTAFPKTFVDMFPNNIVTARRQLGDSRDEFERYVCCPGCNSLYQTSDCVVKKSNGTLESLTCGFVQFPLHPQQCHRKPCGITLMKEMKYASGRKSFFPKRVFCYKSLIDSPQEFLIRPAFTAKCEKWRNKPDIPGVYSDVFDGQV